MKEFTMLSRRAFLHRTSLVSLAPVVPSLFGRIARAAGMMGTARIATRYASKLISFTN
jgi:hypothetical protein